MVTVVVMSRFACQSCDVTRQSIQLFVARFVIVVGAHKNVEIVWTNDLWVKKKKNSVCSRVKTSLNHNNIKKSNFSTQKTTFSIDKNHQNEWNLMFLAPKRVQF